MGNDHRDCVAVFRLQVFNDHVKVNDIQIDVSVNELTGRFAITTVFSE